jgi:outer membrane protein assembly factor BamB
MRSSVLGVTLALLAAGCGRLPGFDGVSEGRIEANEWVLEGMTPDGERLVVSTIFGGVASGCTRFDGWSYEETGEAVTVTASLWHSNRVQDCTDEGNVEVLPIDLEAPLGDRRLEGCGHDDCISTILDAGDLWVGRIAADEAGLAVGGGSGFEIRTTEGDVVSEPEVQTGDVRALLGMVVVDDEGSTVAIDLETGRERWRAPGWVSAALDDTVYLCRGDDGDGLTAVDTATGSDRWSTDLGCHPLVAHGDLLTVVTRDPAVDGGHLLLTIDAATGALLSSAPLFDGIDDQVGGFDDAVAVGTTTVVGGSKADLVVLAADGSELARSSMLRGWPRGEADGAVVVGDWDGIGAADPDTLTELWSMPVANGLATVAVVAGSIWRLDSSAGVVVRLSPFTGDPRWTARVGYTSSFDVAAVDDTAYILTTTALLAVDNTSGEVLWTRNRLIREGG